MKSVLILLVIAYICANALADGPMGPHPGPPGGPTPTPEPHDGPNPDGPAPHDGPNPDGPAPHDGPNPDGPAPPPGPPHPEDGENNQNGGDHGPPPQGQNGPKICKRDFTIKAGPTPHGYSLPIWYAIKGVRACPGSDTAKKADSINARINGDQRPRVDFQWMSANGDSRSAFGFSILFSQLVEYSNAGLNITDDKYVPGQSLVLNRFKFSKQGFFQGVVSEAPVDLGNGTTLYSFTATSQPTSQGNTFAISFEFVTSPTNHSRVTYVPGSAKVNIDVSSYTYSSANATGLAFRTWILNRGHLAPRNSTTVGPNPNPYDQEGVEINDPAATQGAPGAFFTWSRFVNDTTGTEFRVHALRLPPGQDTQDFQENPQGEEMGPEQSISTVWFSVPGRPDGFYWDPTMGIQEAADMTYGATTPDPVGAASAVSLSLWALLVALLAAIAMF